ncbi:unnamed protein product [Soboliphyme baturini]|uniref:SH2 domain-containing protein n=1 Tax=Soboliphyme baturini TaxID=241478 RepID=A0A183IUP0_9BILA|nr:unnamed protein product [Soboliphyme baturini]
MGLVPTPFRPEDLRLHYRKSYQPLDLNSTRQSSPQRFRRTKSMELFRTKKRFGNGPSTRSKFSVTKSLMNRLSRWKSSESPTVEVADMDLQKYRQGARRPVTYYESDYLEQSNPDATGTPIVPSSPEKFRRSLGEYNGYRECIRPSLPQPPPPPYSKMKPPHHWNQTESQERRRPMSTSSILISSTNYNTERTDQEWQRQADRFRGQPTDGTLDVRPGIRASRERADHSLHRRESYAASAHMPVVEDRGLPPEAERSEAFRNKTATVSPMINEISYSVVQKSRADQLASSGKMSTLGEGDCFETKQAEDLPLSEQSLPAPIPADNDGDASGEKVLRKSEKWEQHGAYTEILTVDDVTGKVGSKLVNTFSTVYPESSTSLPFSSTHDIHSEMQQYEKSYQAYRKKYKEISSQARQEKLRYADDVEDTWKNISLEKMLKDIECDKDHQPIKAASKHHRSYSSVSLTEEATMTERDTSPCVRFCLSPLSLVVNEADGNRWWSCKSRFNVCKIQGIISCYPSVLDQKPLFLDVVVLRLSESLKRRGHASSSPSPSSPLPR